MASPGPDRLSPVIMTGCSLANVPIGMARQTRLLLALLSGPDPSAADEAAMAEQRLPEGEPALTRARRSLPTDGG